MAIFLEGLKYSCRECPYSCDIRSAGAESVDVSSADELDDGGDDSLPSNDEHSNDSNSNDGDDNIELENYKQAVIQEVTRRDPGVIPCLSADNEYPDQVFRYPPQQKLHLRKPPLEAIATHMLKTIESHKTQRKRYSKSIINTDKIAKLLIDNLTSDARRVFNKDQIKLAE